MLLAFKGNVNADVSVLTCPFLSRISADRRDWLLIEVCLEQGECWAPECVCLVPNSAKYVAYSLAMCHFFPCLTCLLFPCCQWQFALHKEEKHYPEELQFSFPPAFFFFSLMEFLSKKQIPWWVLFFFFFFFFFSPEETCLFLLRLFHVDMMGLGCTAAPQSPCFLSLEVWEVPGSLALEDIIPVAASGSWQTLWAATLAGFGVPF